MRRRALAVGPTLVLVQVKIRLHHQGSMLTGERTVDEGLRGCGFSPSTVRRRVSETELSGAFPSVQWSATVLARNTSRFDQTMRYGKKLELV